MNYEVYINGCFVPAEEAKISVFDAAYLYGEGLFETMVARGGKVVFFDRHLKRLLTGAERLNIPVPFSQARIQEAVYQTLEKNRLQEAYIRVGLSAEEEDVGIRNRNPHESNLVIFTKPVEPYPSHLYKSGACLILVQSVHNDAQNIAGIKSTNYLTKVIARREIARREADEGVLLNSEGRVTECASSNIFIVKKGKVFTPPLREGLLPGITREVVIELAEKEKIPCLEKPLQLKDLEVADEIFITSTLKGVLPVGRFAKSEKIVPGEITTKLRNAYKALI